MRNNGKCRMPIVLLVAATAFLNLSGLSIAAGDTLSEQYPVIQSDIDYSQNSVYYSRYLSENSSENAAQTVEISLNNVVTSNQKSYLKAENGTLYFDWSDDDLKWAEWKFTVPTPGFFNIEFDYMALPGSVDAPRRLITVDGRELFRELRNIEFPRIWTDKNEPVKDALGDYASPQQVEISRRQQIRINDYAGRYNAPLKIWFTAGEHTLRLSSLAEKMNIYGIALVPPIETASYEEVLEKYQKSGYQEATADNVIKIDAECAQEKSEVSLQRMYSSDPCADPASNGNRVLNTIGGSNWNSGGQSITWKFYAEQSALYKLELRVKTQNSDQLNIYRQIAIDGKVPFTEFENYCFSYGKWRTECLQNEKGNPYLIYLSEGEHTLTITVKTSSYFDILCELEKSLELLSTEIQEIIKITSVSPDSNFDYQLDKKIPTLLDSFQTIAAGIDTQTKRLEEQIGEMPSGANSLLEIKSRLEKMIKNPFIIARNLTYLQDSETTLSNWISAFNNLPMEMDYIVFNSPSEETINPQATVFQYIEAAMRDFSQSFLKDYNSVRGISNTDANKTVKIWISRGKEWGTLLKQYSDESFTAETGIGTEYSILPAGQLGIGGVMMLAVASGTAPDVAIGVGETVPGEYGMRGVLMDLSDMPGYEEIKDRFSSGIMIPYYFENATYGLPETMDFNLMFYRKDILYDLNLKKPDTWDDIFNQVLPTINRNGMDFWYEGGFNLFLFQNGGSFYTEDGTRSALDTPEAENAFKQYTDLYTVYGVPYEANFYNRFRSGQTPIGISTLSTYIRIREAAPELEGKWDISLVPGIKQEDGTIHRGDFVSSTALVIFKNTKAPDEAWKFADWYTGAETQKTYADMLRSSMGSSAQWFSANQEAFGLLSWTSEERKTVMEQLKWVEGMPTVAGGYITARNVENARVRTVLQNMNYRESIEKAVDDIDLELSLKRNEFTQRKEKERKE